MREVRKVRVADLTTSIREGIDLFFVPDTELEIRILKTPKGTISGCFDALDTAVRAVEEAAAMLEGNSTFYATMNPVTREVHARAANRLKPYANVTTSDGEILKRHYLLLDFDPTRPRGVSSTDVELARALARRDEVITWLSGQGWADPVRAMSGNGGHALYSIDLPNDDPSRDLIKACLDVLHQTFLDTEVTIDRAVFNAARICKVYGTIARKGDPTADRPHRRAEIEERPLPRIVTLAQLQALAIRNSPASGASVAAPPRPSTNTTRLDMRAEFEARDWYIGELRNGWHAVTCPWIREHSGASGSTETAIHPPDTPDGLWGFKCQHASCAGRSIRDVWELFRTLARGTATPVSAPTDTGSVVTGAAELRKDPSPGEDHKGASADEKEGLIPLGKHDPKTGRLVLSPSRTLPTARAYVRAFHFHPEGRLVHAYSAL